MSSGGGPPPWSGGRGGGRGRGAGGGWGRGGGWGGGWGPPPPPPQLPQIPPPAPGAVRVAVATIDPSGLSSMVSPRFARAPFITLVDVANGSVIWLYPVKNPFETFPRGAGVSLAQWLIQIGCRVAVGTRFGPNIAAVLSQAGIEMKVVPPGTRVIDALRLLGLVR